MRYNLLNSSAGIPISNSSSLGAGNRRDNANAMSFQNSGYKQKEDNRSFAAQWNSAFGGNKANDLLISTYKSDESRDSLSGTFPLIDIQKDGLTYMSAGFEPFTPGNQLRTRARRLPTTSPSSAPSTTSTSA